MNKRVFVKKWDRYLTIGLSAASLVLFALAGEFVIRAWHFLHWNISFLDGQPKVMLGLSPITVDAELGWRATPNYRFDGKKTSLDGSEYPVQISQDNNGFRMFGDLGSSKTRVLVIGDSFTHAVEVSDQETYYAVLKQKFNVEVFAYGGGGYGSLQEFMILDKYYDTIKPQLIVWQYSTNDFINNSPELEMASAINNNGLRRPYWVDGEIRHILPKDHTADVRSLAIRFCRLCYVILNRIDRLGPMLAVSTVETETAAGKPAHNLFLESVRVTNHLMGMVKNRVGSVPIVTFIVGAGAPQGPEHIEHWIEISRNHDMLLLPDVENEVLTAERSGTIVRAADGAHWNVTGHRIAGEALADALQRQGLLGSPQYSRKEK
jgi:hypothetical protein